MVSAVRQGQDRAAAKALARGFTLIELIVVLAIVGALLALAVPRYVGALERSRLTVQQSNAASLRESIDKFYADQGRYPERLQELVERRYLRQVPVDPVSGEADWQVLPPPPGLPGRVYDVRGTAASAPVETAASAAEAGRAATVDPVPVPGPAPAAP